MSVIGIAVVLALCASAQDEPRFSYEMALDVIVAAPSVMKDSLRSSLIKRLEAIDGVRVTGVAADHKLKVIALPTPNGISAAVAVTSPLDAWTRIGLVQIPDRASATDRRILADADLLDLMIVITGGPDVDDFVRRIADWFHSEYVVADRDVKYQLFRLAQHPK